MDRIPAVTGLVSAAVATGIPGPTHEEWTGVAMAFVALVIREAVWWLRNRRKPK